MSKVLQVSRSGYYRWLKSGPSNRTVENRELTDEIRKIHARSKQTYGSPRITFLRNELTQGQNHDLHVTELRKKLSAMKIADQDKDAFEFFPFEKWATNQLN
ncbi:MAG: hypothetical protein ACI9P8_000942 [Bacteroidia bacterium]|jgi:hypothetical protein